MNLEECYVEMIFHARWMFNYCLRLYRGSEEMEIYAEDFALVKKAFDRVAICEPDSDGIDNIPIEVVQCLSIGVVYLFVARDVFGSVPSILSTYLQNTKLNRVENALHVHIILVRWILHQGGLSIDELLEMIYGPTVSIDSYENEFDAVKAVSFSLCMQEPFYMGAHVTMMRAILLQYCITCISPEDVLCHVENCFNLRPKKEFGSLEDVLLYWIQCVLSKTENIEFESERTEMDNFYLDVIDGRALALLIVFYCPALATIEDVNTGFPLTVEQICENWELIIRVLEMEGRPLQLFTEEILRHSRGGLQLHLLRVTEELFSVLSINMELSAHQYSQNSCYYGEPPVKLNVKNKILNLGRHREVYSSLQFLEQEVNTNNAHDSYFSNDAEGYGGCQEELSQTMEETTAEKHLFGSSWDDSTSDVEGNRTFDDFPDAPSTCTERNTTISSIKRWSELKQSGFNENSLNNTGFELNTKVLQSLKKNEKLVGVLQELISIRETSGKVKQIDTCNEQSDEKDKRQKQLMEEFLDIIKDEIQEKD